MLSKGADRKGGADRSGRSRCRTQRSDSAISLAGTPASSIRVATLLRSRCDVSRSRPGNANATLTSRETFDGSRNVPALDGSTIAISSCQDSLRSKESDSHGGASSLDLVATTGMTRSQSSLIRTTRTFTRAAACT